MYLPQKSHYVCKQLNTFGMDSDKSSKQKFQQFLQLSAISLSVFIPPACFHPLHLLLISDKFFLLPLLLNRRTDLFFPLWLFLPLCFPAAPPLAALHMISSGCAGCLGVSEGNPLPQTLSKSRPVELRRVLKRQQKVSFPEGLFKLLQDGGRNAQP